MTAPGKSNLSSPEVRDTLEADMAAVRDVYAHYVLHSLATFEETAPTIGDMLARRRACVDLGLPYLIAEVGGVVAGFAYAGSIARARPIASPSRTAFMSRTARRDAA
jgi:L-amino acid N-acyltransferase YncA